MYVVSESALNVLKARLGSISRAKLEQIYSISVATHKILSEDLPAIIAEIEKGIEAKNGDSKTNSL
jgi:hypothetical protein